MYDYIILKEGGIPMYKLANIIDPVFQKVVSRQLLEVLNDFAGGRIDYLPDKITVENIVNCYYPQYIPYYGEEKVYDFFMKKIEKMIEELKDPENEYSFDMLGNSILYKALITVNDFWKNIKEDEKPWTAYYPVSDAEKEHLRKMIHNYLENTYQEIVEEYEYQRQASNGEFQETINENFVEDEMEILLARIIDGSKYIYEITGEDNSEAYFEFLFSDRDFLLIDKYPPEKINSFVEICGEKFGLIEIEKTRENLSGSHKIAIGE